MSVKGPEPSSEPSATSLSHREMDQPRRSRYLARATVGLLLGLLGSIARAQNITEFALPTANSGPLSITAGPDGNLWFTESKGNKIGRITPDGVITEFAIATADSSPAGIAAGQDGALWFTEASGDRIGRITTAGAFIEFALVTGSHPSGIVAGPDGALWFTELSGNRIGRITIAGVITEFSVPTGGTGPDQIAVGPDGALWFTEINANEVPCSLCGGIGRITTAGVITEFAAVVNSLADITAGPDGALWFTELSGTRIGRITTGGAITYYAGLTGGRNFGTRSIAEGPDGALWFTEFGIYGGRIGRITTAGVVTEFSIPDDVIPNSHGPYDIAAGPDGALWFTEYLGSKIGRITTGATCTPGSTSLCLNSGRFKVDVTWSVPSQGTSGVGTAVPLTGDTGAFWFFGSNNYELMVKVLDGRAFNGRFWFFSAPGTNVSYTITVTDTVNNVVKTYTSLDGQVTNIQDTSGFLP